MEILSFPHLTFTLIIMASTSSYPSPLFSCIVTLYILIFLYFPSCFLKHNVVFPILISTLVLLLSLLRLGASQQIQRQQQQQEQQQQQQQQQPPPSNKNGVECEEESKDIVHGLENPSFLAIKFEFEFEPESDANIKIDQSQEEARVEQHCNRADAGDSYEPKTELEELSSANHRVTSYKLETRPATEPNTADGTLVNENTSETDVSEEGEEIDPQCNRANTRPSNKLNPEPEPEPLVNTDSANVEDEQKQPGPIDDPKPYCAESFVHWVVWAPLDVIYEAYEGEECEEDDQSDAFIYNNHNNNAGTDQKYPSLSEYYPETDTDTDTDSDNSSASWDEEDKEGMFEIALGYENGDDKSVIVMKKLKKVVEEADEEDNLIEIDISPSKSDTEFNW